MSPPRPRQPDPHWRERALCWRMEPDHFQPEVSRAHGKSMCTETKDARKVCAQCPVIAECAQVALSHQPYGVWAGLSFTGGQMSGPKRDALRRLAGVEAEAS